MADVKISELPAYPSGSSPIGTDIIPIVDTSVLPYVTRQVAFSTFSNATQFTVVSYQIFTGSATGGSGQTFSDANLTNFTTIGQSTIVVDGVVMTPNENYSIVGAQLTILDYMPPNAEVEVIYKVLPGITTFNDLVLQDGTDNLTDQLNNAIITQ